MCENWQKWMIEPVNRKNSPGKWTIPGFWSKKYFGTDDACIVFTIASSQGRTGGGRFGKTKIYAGAMQGMLHADTQGDDAIAKIFRI